MDFTDDEYACIACRQWPCDCDYWQDQPEERPSSVDAVGWPVIEAPNWAEMSEFDRLVEQQDQELAHDGVVSPATQAWRERYHAEHGEE